MGGDGCLMRGRYRPDDRQAQADAVAAPGSGFQAAERLEQAGYLRPHYEAPLLVKNLTNPPAGSWILHGWWTHGAAVLSNSAMDQIMNPLLQQYVSSTLPKNVQDGNVKFYKGNAVTYVMNYLQHHGYTQWTACQPGSRFWPFRWIESGWLLCLSVLLITATIWLVHRRAA